MRKVLSFLMIASVFSAVVFTQENAVVAESNGKNDSEMSVEDAYLESYSSQVINEYVKADGRDNKMVALQYIEKSIEDGNTSPELVKALNSLASEGIQSVSRENGRVINNYPDIRRDACDLLGQVPTVEAKNALIQVLYTDNEPMVITAAVRSLGEIGLNDNDEATAMITMIARKFDIVNPTSSLALEILDAFEKLAPITENPSDMIQMIIKISSNYQYVTPVRQRARKVLESISLQKRAAKENGQQKNNGNAKK